MPPRKPTPPRKPASPDAPSRSRFAKPEGGRSEGRASGGANYNGDRSGAGKSGGGNYNGDRSGSSKSSGANYSSDRSGAGKSSGANYNGDRSGSSKSGGAHYSSDRSGAGRTGGPKFGGGKFGEAKPYVTPKPKVPRAGGPRPATPRAAADDGTPREGDRIAKLLARAGIASRREVERMIEDGRVKLNDQVVTTPATLLMNLRGVSVDGKPVAAAAPPRLFRFHKPAGLITAERDPTGRPTIYTALRNALPADTPRVMPVGRLDLNTEGLLLLTNDGELKRAMELPSSSVPRTYRARTFGDITQDRLEELSEGIEIDGIRYGSIDANMERRTGRNQWVELTLTEGKNREVRRVLEHLGLQVSRLLRLRYGPFELEDLPRGQAVEIPQVLVERFRKTLKTGV